MRRTARQRVPILRPLLLTGATCCQTPRPLAPHPRLSPAPLHPCTAPLLPPCSPVFPCAPILLPFLLADASSCPAPAASATASPAAAAAVATSSLLDSLLAGSSTPDAGISLTLTVTAALPTIVNIKQVRRGMVVG